MKYQVFEGKKPADCFHCHTNKSWNNSVFDSFEEACKYAIHWAYPYDDETINQKYETYWKNVIKVGVPIDMGMTEFPVIMVIREI